jgi:hypothetical protein
MIGGDLVKTSAVYALLLEETWGVPVKRAFFYSLVQRKSETVPIVQHLRQNVL